MAKFEGQERRMPKIEACLAEYGWKTLEDADALCKEHGINVEEIVKGVQPIAFENACWAYTLGTAIALKKGCKVAADASEAIGLGLQAFCIPGSVAEQRAVGLGHGNLGAMLLREETDCFCFLAGHESFAAAEGAIGIARTANKARKKPLRVILNGLGKDAAYIISRINGFTYVETEYDFTTGDLKVVREVPFSEGDKAKVRCYGANDVLEGVAIMKKEKVDVSITGNSTNPTRFLRLDRLHGPYAWRRAVCRFFLRTCSRRNDGPDRYGQQPHGWRHRCLRGCSRRSVEIIFLSVKKEDGFSVLFLFCRLKL